MRDSSGFLLYEFILKRSHWKQLFLYIASFLRNILVIEKYDSLAQKCSKVKIHICDNAV